MSAADGAWATAAAGAVLDALTLTIPDCWGGVLGTCTFCKGTWPDLNPDIAAGGPRGVASGVDGA